MFDLDIKVSSNEYFDLIRKLECLTSENEHLKGLNKNQMNTIIDMRNEITDLKKQVGDLCELVGKAKKESEDLKRKLDTGCNTCPDMENTKKKNDELRELIDFKRKQIEKQATTICDLDKKFIELRAGAKDLQEQNQILKDKLRSMCENCDVPDNCVNASEAVLKDADAKIQSANDRAANAKKEAKVAKERAERYREENFVLTRKIDQFKKLNDELIKELARKGED